MSNPTNPHVHEQKESTVSASVCGPGRWDLGWPCIAPNILVYFVVLILFSVLLAKGVTWSCQYKDQTPRQQRNVVTYIVGLLVKTTSFATILWAGAPTLLSDEPLNDEEMRVCLACGILPITTFYLWEMMYRIDMDVMLFIHHLSTIILIILSSVGSFRFEQDLLSMSQLEERWEAIRFGRLLVFRITLVELLAASTNQPVLVALLLHRARFSASHLAFLAAAYWEAFSKNLRFVVVLIFYGQAYAPSLDQHCNCTRWCWELRITYPVLAVIIWAANMHTVHLLWRLSRRPKYRISEDQIDTQLSSSENIGTKCMANDNDISQACAVEA